MKKKSITNSTHLWIVFPVLFILLCVVVATYVYVPLGRQVFLDAKRLFGNYTKKNDASIYPQKKRLLEKEVAMLDSALQEIEARGRHRRTLVEQLYEFADSSGFTTGKVEIGVPQSVDGIYETAISIKGKGRFRATGAFAERIENCLQSTRIRLLCIKAHDSDEPEVFIDLAVREEENTSTGNIGR